MRAVMAGYTLKKLIYMKPSAVSLWVDVCVRKWAWLWRGCLPREKWCYLDWPFSLRVTGCRLAGGLCGVGGAVIRTHRNCRVRCSWYRCQKRQTVWRPYQVQKSSLKQRTGGGGVTQSFSPEAPLCESVLTYELSQDSDRLIHLNLLN